jgi:hypothetical protein
VTLPYRWLAALGAVGGVLAAVALSGDSDAGRRDLVVPHERVRVEVLNAGGVSGMARDVTGRLRNVGFDVVDFGNAAAFDPGRPSAVIDRVGRLDVAGAVAEALGIDNVLSEPDSNLYVDVSVLVGSEWKHPAVPAAAAADPGGTRR